MISFIVYGGNIMQKRHEPNTTRLSILITMKNEIHQVDGAPKTRMSGVKLKFLHYDQRSKKTTKFGGKKS